MIIDILRFDSPATTNATLLAPNDRFPLGTAE
jgi:hypothetical protein